MVFIESLWLDLFVYWGYLVQYKSLKKQYHACLPETCYFNWTVRRVTFESTWVYRSWRHPSKLILQRFCKPRAICIWTIILGVQGLVIYVNREVADSRMPDPYGRHFIQDTACFHCYLIICDSYIVVQWITKKTCQIPYENVCRTGVRNLSNVCSSTSCIGGNNLHTLCQKVPHKCQSLV